MVKRYFPKIHNEQELLDNEKINQNFCFSSMHPEYCSDKDIPLTLLSLAEACVQQHTQQSLKSEFFISELLKIKDNEKRKIEEETRQ